MNMENAFLVGEAFFLCRMYVKDILLLGRCG